MDEEKMKCEGGTENDQISKLWNDELKTSSRALTNVIRGLDPGTRQEVLEVLKLIGEHKLPKDSPP
jgi:hypothetical protein